MLSLKDEMKLLNQEIKDRLLHGEFWIVPEEDGDIDSAHLHNDRPVILANTWELNALPGRKFRMEMLSESDTGGSPAIGLETLHRTWNDMIKPVLNDILRLSGWEH